MTTEFTGEIRSKRPCSYGYFLRSPLDIISTRLYVEEICDEISKCGEDVFRLIVSFTHEDFLVMVLLYASGDYAQVANDVLNRRGVHPHSVVVDLFTSKHCDYCEFAARVDLDYLELNFPTDSDFNAESDDGLE